MNVGVASEWRGRVCVAGLLERDGDCRVGCECVSGVGCEWMIVGE
jgi:hypothetical protein